MILMANIIPQIFVYMSEDLKVLVAQLGRLTESSMYFPKKMQLIVGRNLQGSERLGKVVYSSVYEPEPRST